MTDQPASGVNTDLINKAIQLSSQGDYKYANSILLDIVSSGFQLVKLHYLIGHNYWEMGDLATAASHFSILVNKLPTNESASLSLFHCLWRSDHKLEALEESKRFLSMTESQQYREIILDINNSATA